MTLLIVVGVFVLVALFFGYRYDRRHRGSGSGDGTTARGLRLDGKEKGARWGAGGGN